MSADKLKGQFLKGDIPKLKKVSKNNVLSCSNNISDFGGYKQNGWIFPKRGAL